MAAYLELSIGSLTPLRIETFLNESLPRVDASSGDGVNYTASGSIVLSSPQYESFSLWNVDAQISREQYSLLLLIWSESNYQLRNNGAANILVKDRTLIYQERLPRTRALVVGTAASIKGSYVEYYAAFNAVMIKRPEARKMGLGYAVNFTLQETDRTIA